MTDPTTLPATIERPTPKSEWTLAGALFAVWLLALIFGVLIAMLTWPDSVAETRIVWLGRALIGALICNGLIVLAFISPWVGTVKLTGPAASLELDGKDHDHG